MQSYKASAPKPWGSRGSHPQAFHCLKLATSNRLHGMESKQRLAQLYEQEEGGALRIDLAHQFSD
ncbi:hypothetical protein BFP71_14295 [Roseivirga misakiensis]|uniref:Uncharacterized protein n=1 Tax=Roseivirga misakiensis TaxID=1563681 RepID=A0A1E5SZS1_9BACT|nr:hypothetical protein BFP71_14295 [Roseivirga misakiensis]